jgi:uncharacterized repeat protein (TIGR03803 family)
MEAPMRRRPVSVAILTALTLSIAAALTPAHAQTFSVLYNFGTQSSDPCKPYNSGIVAQGRDGNLYSTATSCGANDAGAAFKITPAGTFTVLYDFGSDGTPFSGLTLGTDGNFYGTTVSGGTSGDGTIFKITPSGSKTILYNFTGFSDGYTPYAPPVQGTDGNFYGTTSRSGSVGIWGTVWKLTPSGTFTTLYRFDMTHGRAPLAPLVQGTDGNFYGTTSGGGTGGGGCGGEGCGVVFKITTAGKLTVLYNFDVAHGQSPDGPLVQGSDGNFYGTTIYGGNNGNGVIFRITPSGTVTVLHNMNAATDGASNYAGLVQASDGSFYGATVNGGTDNAGTFFKITRTGSYSVLHTFDGATGANAWVTPFQHTNGIVYGDTQGGGTGNQVNCPTGTCGVVYSWSAKLPAFVTLQPYSGKVGSQIGILGQGFSSSSVVKFNGVKATTVKLTGTTFLLATVPVGTLDGYVTVTTGTTTLKSSQQFVVHNSWGSGKAMPTARFGAFAGAIGEKIYVVGGATNSGYQVTNVNEIYNTQTNTWTTGAPDPTPRELGASAVVNGILYVIGGSTGGSNPLTLVEAYNPVSNTWTTKAPMPTARNSMPAVVDKNVIYVIGGYDPNTQVFDDTVESYNTTTDTWTEEKPLPVATAWEAVGLLGITVVAADGQISPGTVVGTNEGYNPSTNTWTGLTADPTPRLEACFATISGELYVAGGANATQVLNVNEAYSGTTKKWTTLASMPNALQTAGSATVGGRLYCFGGANSNLSSIYNNVQIYQP